MFLNQQWIKPHLSKQLKRGMVMQRKKRLRRISCESHCTQRTPQLQVLYSQTAALQLQSKVFYPSKTQTIS